MKTFELHKNSHHKRKSIKNFVRECRMQSMPLHSQGTCHSYNFFKMNRDFWACCIFRTPMSCSLINISLELGKWMRDFPLSIFGAKLNKWYWSIKWHWCKNKLYKCASVRLSSLKCVQNLIRDERYGH